MLNFKEKRVVQKTLSVQFDVLTSNPKFSEKRNAQKLIVDCFEKLGANANASNDESPLEQNEITPLETIEPTPIAAKSPLEQNPETRKDTLQFYEYDPNRKPAQRKRENAAAIALLNQIEAGEIDGANLTNEQKSTLVKYTGLGGNKSKAGVGKDGQFGSTYEYYTPLPIAQGMWDLAKELGFSGGKVLDPCAGVGIFGATAPLNAAVDAVELDETSGKINRLVNQGTGFNVTPATPFEKVASATPDDEYSAIISNVPFGDNSERGANKSFDKRYQKETLQGYFILRCLEKLKPKGLAVFIVPPSVVTGRDSKSVDVRERASYMAEFLGAYRLPNSVFGTAAADTVTDVIAFRKFDKPTLDKIQELKEQNPKTLIDANVQWQEFLDGQYFKGEGKRFILGEQSTGINQWGKEVAVIKTNKPISETAKLLRKFPDSRIEWDLLDATETDVIIYNEGDTITQAGQTLEFRNGTWNAIESTIDTAQFDALGEKLSTPYKAFENHVMYAKAIEYRDYMKAMSQMLDMPGWLTTALKEIAKLSESDRQKCWNAGIIGLSCVQVLEERLSQETGINYREEYPDLSEAMQRVSQSAKSCMSKVGGDLKQGLSKIGQNYTKKDGFSSLWRGDVLHDVIEAQTNVDMGFNGLLYKNKSIWASLDDAKTIYGENFNPIESDDWCISSDGKQVCRADDCYSGSYRDFISRIDKDIADATDQQIKDKLLRQKLVAQSRLDKIDVKSLSFNLFSPHVTVEEKADFMRKFVHPNATVVWDEKTGEKRVDIDIKIDNRSTDRDKLFNRVGDYMKNGTITVGTAKLNVNKGDALRELRKIVNTANEQFDGWVKANPQIMNRLEQVSNHVDNIEFKQPDDEAPLTIPNMNPDLELHGYQNSFVRKTGRDFSGINGFAVGLGKTFSALAAVQYVQSIGVKKKALFVVPNSVLSNWQKESKHAYQSTDDCLYVGLRENSKGKEVVNASFIDVDLNSVLENRHSKIFVTYETLERIRLRDETISEYERYLSETDRNFEVTNDVKEREKSNSKKVGLIEVLSSKNGSAPYLEEMGIDSIVIDEGHYLKNSAQTHDTKSAKFLSLGAISKRGIDAQAKAWFIRGKSERGDGVLMLTATPITNSPLEIYSMLSLAKGHDKVNRMMLGIKGADDFMAMMTQIENQDDVTMDGIERTTNVFTGLNNVGVLRRAMNQTATIKTAEDVGSQVALPDSDDNATSVSLNQDAVDKLQLYKSAFRYAIDLISEKNPNRGNKEAFEFVSDYFGESLELVGHPFNLINKMTLLIADPELDRRATFFTISPENGEKAKSVIAEFNAKKFIEKRPRKTPFTQESAVVGRVVTKDEETGDESEVLKIEVRAMIDNDGKTIVIDTMDSTIQQRWDDLADKVGLDLNVTIPPKLAALLENVQKEQAHPRGVDDDGNKSPIVKQIIFCDILAQHSKIKRLLAKKAGISNSKIAIITGKTNNTPEEIMAVQDGFNAHGEENQYNIIIANQKAEVGINLQKGTQAIHHLSIGWTPDSLTQRNGRGVRQGNKTEKVTVYTYDADGTFDAVKRTMVSKKANWIDNVMAQDGENKVSISGGLSKEQLEALIDVTGDKDAMSRIQASIDAKESEARAKTNVEKQKVNLDTIVKQTKFINENDPIKDFIIPKIVRAWSIDSQIKAVNDKISNPKATPTAIARNQNILGQLEAVKRGLIAEIDGSCVIKKGSQGGSGETTAGELIDKFNSGWGKKNAEELRKDLQWSHQITTIEGSALETEWRAEIDMAKSMIDTALSNFKEQSKQAGGLPDKVADMFISGEANYIGSYPVTNGAFIRAKNNDDVILCTIKIGKNWNGNTTFQLNGIFDGKKISGADYQYSYGTDFILQGSPDYENCLIEAAKLEDEYDFNNYSDINSEVAKYRTKAKMVEYSSNEYHLPPPYFPIAIGIDDLTYNPLLKPIADKQSEIIKVLNSRSYGCNFKADATIEMIEANDDLTLESVFIEYVIANNIKLKAHAFSGSATAFRYYREAIQEKIAESTNVDEFKLLLEKESDKKKCYFDYIISKVPYFDFDGMMTIEVFSDYAPSEITSAYKDSIKVELKENPDDIVAIGGNTFDWKVTIRDFAIKYGDSKYKWDGKNKAWNVKRITLNKIFELNTKAVRELKLQPATITHW